LFAGANKFSFDELVFLQSFLQLNLASQPQSASPSHGLSLPTAQIRTKGTLVWQASISAFVPSLGFGTLMTVYSLSSLVSQVSAHRALGIPPSKHPLTARYEHISVPMNPPAVISRLINRASSVHGSERLDFWDLTLTDNPGSPQRFSQWHPVCFHGVCLSRVSRLPVLCPFQDHSSHLLSTLTSNIAAVQSINQPVARNRINETEASSEPAATLLRSMYLFVPWY
jgi:hypothetical protein